jgi:glycosyltransferase involved in cell wall biosynthesis
MGSADEGEAPLRVLVDASAAFNQGAGIGRYAREVLAAVRAELPAARFRYVYAPSRPGPPPFDSVARGALAIDGPSQVRRLPFSRRRADQLWFRARLPLPIELFGGRADVVYSPDFTVPFTPLAPRLVTIHDLAFELHPQTAPAPLRRYLSAVVPRQVAVAAHILTVSETTRRDLHERWNVPFERMTTVPNGVDERFFAAQPLAPPRRARLNLPDDYLLFVGTVEPRKNLTTLFAALQLGGTDDAPPLMIAGAKGWSSDPIYAAADELVAAGRVRFLGYVPDEDLPGLYAGAAAVVYPSWYEGFGLPVLEGLAAGVPVVASTVPALREVGGDQVFYGEPAEPASLADALARALAAPSDGRDRENRRAVARRYRWEESGRRLAVVLRAIGGAH